MKRLTVILATVSVALAIPAVASASTTFDPSSGTGFVGKGDVQQVFGLNNSQLQNDANSIRFTYNSTETKVTENTWDCLNNAGKLVGKQDTTTTDSSTTGVTTTATRVKNQVTGFNLTGFTGTPTTTSSTSTDGTPLDQCGTGQTYVEGSDTSTTISDSTDQYLAASDGTKTPAATALDGYNVWHLTDGLNPVTGSVNYNTSNGSVY